MDFSWLQQALEFLKDTKSLLGGLGIGSLVSWILALRKNKNKITNMTSDGFIVFKNDADPLLVARLCADIEKAERGVCFIGLGHTMLRHNDALKTSLANLINKNKGIDIQVFYSAASAGLQSRVQEEQMHYAAKYLNYDDNWVEEYPRNIVAFLKSIVDVDDEDRVLVARLAYMPMFNLIRVDSTYFFYVYGCPSIRGPDSPWTLIEPSVESALKQFFDKNVTFARAHCGPNLLR